MYGEDATLISAITEPNFFHATTPTELNSLLLQLWLPEQSGGRGTAQ